MSINNQFLYAIAAWLLFVNAGEAGHEKLVQKVYQVADLVLDCEWPAQVTDSLPEAVKTPAQTWGAFVIKTRPKTCEDRLIKIITSTIAPRSWADEGGVGTIEYHPLTLAIVVNQTPNVQDQIADLLAALRRALDKEVTVEVKFAEVCVTQDKEQKQSRQAKHTEPADAPCRTTDFRTPTIPPVWENNEACSEPPDETRILRALGKPMRLPGICEESRDNIAVVTERIVDKMDAPRFFPLVGPAQLHHCHWKCTVYYMETIRGTYPFAFQWKQPRIHVVYMDTDHLHLVSTDEPHVK